MEGQEGSKGPPVDNDNKYESDYDEQEEYQQSIVYEQVRLNMSSKQIPSTVSP